MKKTNKVSFDFSDQPHLLEMLGVIAAQEHLTKKAVLVEALQAYFAEKFDNAQLYKLSEKAFAEWDNQEDKVYDTF